MPTPPTPVITVHDAAKTYTTPAGDFPALRDVSLTVAPGEFVTVTGRSGSGKSTLLNLLAGIDRPTSGSVVIAGTDVHTLPESRLSSWRGRTIGMVFQFFQLLPTLTIAENVMLPMDFCATRPPRERHPHALHLLDTVGIADHADKLPAALSGGQQQRAAIARALANNPPVLLADEPTGNLDSATADMILELFTAQADTGTAIVMVTHERDLSTWAHRQIHLADGRIAHQDTP
ncbi:putative ABC transport system ATP-binding protein [Sinosporangium album]|uniref:Putative ABC transport system ATP-binding protein n=1 Tax=Sinosporangium album TaxID=504805 RepID=A0A1G8DLB6_9ACTN|nr:ABC transporter ATP-binding protein [Sinosporangium album]SDH58448.1 putative ABC transport system ATP-binding protein [Sinosporangium album]